MVSPGHRRCLRTGDHLIRDREDPTTAPTAIARIERKSRVRSSLEVVDERHDRAVVGRRRGRRGRLRQRRGRRSRRRRSGRRRRPSGARSGPARYRWPTVGAAARASAGAAATASARRRPARPRAAAAGSAATVGRPGPGAGAGAGAGGGDRGRHGGGRRGGRSAGGSDQVRWRPGRPRTPCGTRGCSCRALPDLRQLAGPEDRASAMTRMMMSSAAPMFGIVEGAPVDAMFAALGSLRTATAEPAARRLG